MSFENPCDPLPEDENLGSHLLMTAAILLAPTILTTILRLWARKKVPGWDDFTIAIAAVLTIALNVLSIYGVQNGKGRHVCFLHKKQILEIGKYSWINQIVLFWALFFIKMSVCLLILRVKKTKFLRLATVTIIGLMATSTCIACAALIAECRPVSAFWDRLEGECRPPDFRIYSIWVQAGKPQSKSKMSISLALLTTPIAVSVVTDLACSLLPFFILRNLQMPLRKKLAVGVLMVLGTM